MSSESTPLIVRCIAAEAKTIGDEYISSIAASVFQTILAQSNASRARGLIVNKANRDLYLNCGIPRKTFTASDPFTQLSPNGTIFIYPDFTGVIYGIWANTGLTPLSGFACVHEMFYT